MGGDDILICENARISQSVACKLRPWVLSKRICFGWKSFNTHAIESYPACCGTSLHVTYRGSLYDFYLYWWIISNLNLCMTCGACFAFFHLFLLGRSPYLWVWRYAPARLTAPFSPMHERPQPEKTEQEYCSNTYNNDIFVNMRLNE